MRLGAALATSGLGGLRLAPVGRSVGQSVVYRGQRRTAHRGPRVTRTVKPTLPLPPPRLPLLNFLLLLVVVVVVRIDTRTPTGQARLSRPARATKNAKVERT